MRASYDHAVEPDAADREWIRTRYPTLAELCAARGEEPDRWRARIAAGEMPGPSYELDGEGRFPPGWFGLVDEAGSVAGLRAHFEERFAIAADETGAVAGPDELDEAWEEYLSGAWGRVLFDPTPESAVQANRLAGSIAELIAAPAPADPLWCRRLGARIGALAALLREGCGADRANGEPHPWDLWVAAPRRDYADVIADPDAGSTPE